MARDTWRSHLGVDRLACRALCCLRYLPTPGRCPRQHVVQIAMLRAQLGCWERRLRLCSMPGLGSCFLLWASFSSLIIGNDTHPWCMRCVRCCRGPTALGSGEAECLDLQSPNFIESFWIFCPSTEGYP